MTENIEVLQGKHKDKPCAITGSGPSILKVKKYYFSPDEIIIALNNSIIQIEKLNLNNTIYSMQKDAGIIRPKRSILLVSEHESKFAFEDYSPRYVFNTKKMFDGQNTFSANVALRIAKLFGCSKITMIGFDAHTNGDTRRVGLDETISRDGRNYMEQRAKMHNLIQQDKLNVKFVT